MASDIPSMTDYAMTNRTYRYLPADRSPLFPFGFGLSYSEFWYLDVKHNASISDDGKFSLLRNNDIIEVIVIFANVGHVDAEEVLFGMIRGLFFSETFVF